MFTAEAVKLIFDREKILIGSNDVIPAYKVMELMGKEAYIFASTVDKCKYANGYGIDGYTLNYLTYEGLKRAATFVNIKSIQEMEKAGIANGYI